MIEFQQSLDKVVSRPEMFGLDRRYMTLVGFIMGYDEATGRTLLHGFKYWIGLTSWRAAYAYLLRIAHRSAERC
jgi:hypothetical protein